MALTRRSFFGALTAGIAGMTLDPERALWVPGRKTFFIPDEPKIVTARTMDDAFYKGIVGIFPNGRHVMITSGDLTAEVEAIRRLGGTVRSMRSVKGQLLISREIEQARLRPRMGPSDYARRREQWAADKRQAKIDASKERQRGIDWMFRQERLQDAEAKALAANIRTREREIWSGQVPDTDKPLVTLT